MKKLYSFLIQYGAIPLLILVTLLAFGLRMFWLDQAPKGALIDEAHFGYLAYSLLETGKDEHGQSWPLIFTGFGDNKLPAGAYLLLPIVKVWGLNNVTIRIPSVLAGTLLVLIFYFLCRELGFGKKSSLVGAGLVAISPWSFFLSRFGFESNLGLFFWSMGWLAFFKYKKTSSLLWGIIWASSWALTWYAYISYRPITAVMMIYILGATIFANLPKTGTIALQLVTALKKSSFYFLIAVLFGILVGPFFLPSVIAANSTRLAQVGIAADPAIARGIIESRTFCSERAPRVWCYAMWNKGTIMGRKVLNRYVHSFAPQFLATLGEGESEFLTFESSGQLPVAVYPFFVIGFGWMLATLFSLFAKGEFKTLANSPWSYLLVALVVSPIPTALVGNPQQVRISPLFPFVIIAIVVGVQQFFSALSKYRLAQLAVATVVGGAVLGQTAIFLTDFYTVHTTKYEYYYQSYVPGLMTYLQTQVDPATDIFIKPTFSDPLMFFAYYTKMDPQLYQDTAVLGEKEASGFQHTTGLGNLHVSSESWEYLGCQGLRAQRRTIVVTNEDTSALVLYKAQSSNGVHTYTYAYDVTARLDPKKCQIALPSEQL